MKIFTLYLLTILLFHNHISYANDSAAAIGAGGIQFHKTEGVVMEKEDLIITPEHVSVVYIFKNVTEKDITVDLFFPLPTQSEISAQQTWDKEVLDEMKAQNKQHNSDQIPFENFSVKVDGQKVPFKTEIRALQNGKDITSLFQTHKLHFSPVLAACDYPIAGEKEAKACGERMNRYKAFGLLSPEGKPLWQKQVSYHWTQTFPKGKEVKIEHSYRPARGSFFLERQANRPPMESLIAQLLSRGEWIEQFCPWQDLNIKENFVPWIIKKFQEKSKSSENPVMMFYEVDYILTTGANWDGPIRDFTLTVEYPKGGTVASCWPFDQTEIKDIGNNKIRFHQKDFKPEQDLKILFGAYSE